MLECSFDGCHRGVKARDLCAVHYNQQQLGKPLTPLHDGDGYLQAKFWELVDKSGDCWMWTAKLHDTGYGVIQHAGTRHRTHRLAYEWAHGPIADGLVIDHLCFNRACVRPDHLRTVTQRQNSEHRSGPNVRNSSGVRGVTFHAHTGKWRAQVRQGNKNHYCGVYPTIKEAEAAAIAKRNELFTGNRLDRVGGAE